MIKIDGGEVKVTGMRCTVIAELACAMKAAHEHLAGKGDKSLAYADIVVAIRRADTEELESLKKSAAKELERERLLMGGKHPPSGG